MGFVTVTIVAVVGFLFVGDTDDDPATVNTVDAVADEPADVETAVGDVGVDTADTAASDSAVSGLEAQIAHPPAARAQSDTIRSRSRLTPIGRAARRR